MLDKEERMCYNTEKPISPHRGYKERGMTHHSHEHDKAVQNRLSRAIGHMNAVKRMVDEGRDCSELLIQLSAIRAEITSLSKLILKEHLEHCLVDAIKTGDEHALAELKGAIDKLL